MNNYSNKHSRPWQRNLPAKRWLQLSGFSNVCTPVRAGFLFSHHRPCQLISPVYRSLISMTQIVPVGHWTPLSQNLHGFVDLNWLRSGSASPHFFIRLIKSRDVLTKKGSGKVPARGSVRNWDWFDTDWMIFSGLPVHGWVGSMKSYRWQIFVPMAAGCQKTRPTVNQQPV